MNLIESAKLKVESVSTQAFLDLRFPTLRHFSRSVHDSTRSEGEPVNQNISDETQEDEVPKKSGIGFLTLMIFFLVAAAAGSAVPFMLPNLFAPELHSKVGTSSAGGDAISVNDMTYVFFGESTVNLDEGRMNRYLRLKMSLQVKQKDKERLEDLLERKNLVLRNWLLSHLSDKTLDEIRGKAGQNMLRREIRNHFNTTLFSDGHDRIYDILFEEFNVQ